MSTLEDNNSGGFTRRQARTVIWISQVGAALSLLASVLLQDPYHTWGVFGALILMMVQFLTAWLLSRKSVRMLDEHRQLLDDAREAREQVERLFRMTDMLQSTESVDDAGAVLEATSRYLLPGIMGALYIFNNSRDRLDLARSWSDGDNFNPPEMLMPSNCWALKRGKEHLNDQQPGTLCCMHHAAAPSVMEMPMMARGTVHGLLMLASPHGDARAELHRATRVGRALADSVSLALSNIDLREKLRRQSLRDPLTGLYNRRYMEDALERQLSMASRNGQPTSAVMIDLDHFKALNDEHGHAKGDVVLRDVAKHLVDVLRPSDVVCRYGGEELLVILPECGLDAALDKAELMRSRIEALSNVHETPISASLGVACVPETSGGNDLLPMADAALYEAKRSGRNRVKAAGRRETREGPRLAAVQPPLQA